RALAAATTRRGLDMPVKAAYFLAIPGFADWEAAHALAELRRHGRYRVRVVGIERRPVTSMGGLTVHPDGSLVDVDFDDVAIMILPGGDRWEREPVEGEIAKALEECVARGIPIAAICAATTAVARLGLCRGRQHTSNGLAYLQRQVPTYADAATYIDVPAVR